MKKSTVIAALLCLVVISLHAEATPLFRMTSDQGTQPGGSPPGMAFQETERQENTSTVEASQEAGSAAAKSLFLLRGSCALMKERNKQAFTIEHLSRQPIRFKLNFVSADAATDPGTRTPGKIVTRKRCELVQAVLRQGDH